MKGNCGVNIQLLSIFLFVFVGYLILLNFLNLLGHGGSDGLHAYVPSLDDAVADMVCFTHPW